MDSKDKIIQDTYYQYIKARDNPNVIYKYDHLSHDGYDKYGPKSNLYDHYIYIYEYSNYKVIVFHYEDWFCGDDYYYEKINEVYLSDVKSLECLINLFKFCYDNLNDFNFKLAYQQKLKEMNIVESQPETHIKRRLESVKSPMLSKLYNDIKFLYFYNQSKKGPNYTMNNSHWIYDIHTIIKEDDDFVCVWYSKERTNFNDTDYVESNRLRLSEITTLESLKDNFNIKYIMEPYIIKFIDNPEFVIAYENKLAQLLV
uniref:Uncharacterized protein n=1 Tax=viral metagenome TaxID=1070528 RepID=A0A6C0DAH2_9ZZZZ